MPLPLIRLSCVAILLFTALQARANAAPRETVWALNSLDHISGTPAEIWGKPVLSKSGGQNEVQFDGKADGLLVPAIAIGNWNRFTIEMLFKPEAGGLPEQRCLHLQDEKGRRLLIEIRVLNDGDWCLDTFLYSNAGHRLTLIDRTLTHPLGGWHWVALTYADGHMTHFVDGVKECGGEVQFEPMDLSGRTSIGVRQNKVSWFKGAIREIRFTPDALPADKLRRADPHSPSTRFHPGKESPRPNPI